MPQQMMPNMTSPQPNMMTSQQPNMMTSQQPNMMSSNPFGVQQPQQMSMMPQIPPRVAPQQPAPAAMVATQQQPSMVASNNQVFGANLMSPTPKPSPAQQANQQPSSDPFSDIGQLGSGNSSGKEMFKNFQIGGNPGIDD